MCLFWKPINRTGKHNTFYIIKMLLMNLAGETCPGVRIFLYCCLTSSRVIFVDIKKAVRGLTCFVILFYIAMIGVIYISSRLFMLSG